MSVTSPRPGPTLRQTAPDLTIGGLGHAYDGEPVLTDIDLRVGAGECLALLGPSGCGKTTLLRAIAGLERPTSGRIVIGDRPVLGERVWVPPEQRSVGMVFQEWALFPHLSVSDNVGYGLDRRERKGPAVAEALALVGLDGLGERMPHTLSGGQQQRVALARAIAPRPRVLLLDEPFSNLDTALRLEVRSEVHRLLTELDITSVFVTHDQEEAFVLGDRVAVMREGRVLQADTPQQLYHNPVSRWVGEFVGSATVVVGEARSGSVVTPFGSAPVDPSLAGPVEVLIRPEHLAVAAGGTASVELVEFYGHDAMVFVDVDGKRLGVRCGPAVTWRRGDRVDVRFVADKAPAFPL